MESTSCQPVQQSPCSTKFSACGEFRAPLDSCLTSRLRRMSSPVHWPSPGGRACLSLPCLAAPRGGPAAGGPAGGRLWISLDPLIASTEPLIASIDLLADSSSTGLQHHRFASTLPLRFIITASLQPHRFPSATPLRFNITASLQPHRFASATPLRFNITASLEHHRFASTSRLRLRSSCLIL